MMQGKPPSEMLHSIDLSVTERLQDVEFRREWFRAELEETVPADFRALRERRKLTQTELARLMGTKQPAISRFEKSADAVWEFGFLLRWAEAVNARLRVVIEAAEDVIGEYAEGPQTASSSSALTHTQSGAAYAYGQGKPTFGMKITGILDETDKRGIGQGYRAGQLQVYSRQSVLRGPSKRDGSALSV